MKRLIKVLVIDDSALVRQTLRDIIQSDRDLMVTGTAGDPYFAAQKIREEIPDVITLDIEMPRMDGLTFLKSLMAQYPIPVIIISSLTQYGSHLAIRALELGAVEIVAKSEIRNTKEHLEESRIRITDAIKAARLVPMRRKSIHRTATEFHQWNTKIKSSIYKTTDKVIAIGASTGGTDALRFILQKIRPDLPGILIAQHMPAGFTKSFADHLNSQCEVTVKEATDSERVMRGHAYIAPGGKHLELYRSGAQYFIKVRDGQLVNRHKPSVNVLFDSVARHAGQNAIGIIMTGMGNDGATGLLAMKNAGALTIAQDEASSVVYGMPREAVALDAARQVISLADMPSKLLSYFS
ncbi:MAG TPA: chemotaxis response regulator protein-glutamate methylesterase [Chryseolinea sp.]